MQSAVFLEEFVSPKQWEIVTVFLLSKQFISKSSPKTYAVFFRIPLIGGSRAH